LEDSTVFAAFKRGGLPVHLDGMRRMMTPEMVPFDGKQQPSAPAFNSQQPVEGGYVVSADGRTLYLQGRAAVNMSEASALNVSVSRGLQSSENVTTCNYEDYNVSGHFFVLHDRLCCLLKAQNNLNRLPAFSSSSCRTPTNTRWPMACSKSSSLVKSSFVTVE
jgi:hypothetical protein